MLSRHLLKLFYDAAFRLIIAKFAGNQNKAPVGMGIAARHQQQKLVVRIGFDRNLIHRTLPQLGNEILFFSSTFK